MAGITLAQAEAKLALWMQAEEALAVSQSYSIEVDGSRRELVRADLKEIAQRIEYWNSKVVQFSRRASGRSNSRNVVN